MNILYDGRIYTIQNTGGVNRYFANLISRLPATFVPYLTLFQDHQFDFPTHPNLVRLNYKRVKFRPVRLANQVEKLYAFWFEKHYFHSVKGLQALAIAHPTWNTLLTHQPIRQYPCPVVITVHDMIQELLPDLVHQSDRQIEAKKKAIFAAHAIICVSENTKKDLLELYKIPEDRVFVTPLASELTQQQSYGTESIPAKPYFLYVGSRYSYKNFDGLLTAFAQVISVHPDMSLCVVGLPFSEAEKQKISALHLTNNISHYHLVDDCHLAKLYRCSLAFVYPSLYEGFGIPPLEAMACGTPVVASNCSSLPEVIADAGILFNPKAANDLADILLLLINNSGERDRLIAKGAERVKLFSWDKTTELTVKVYQGLAA